MCPLLPRPAGNATYLTAARTHYQGEGGRGKSGEAGGGGGGAAALSPSSPLHLSSSCCLHASLPVALLCLACQFPTSFSHGCPPHVSSTPYVTYDSSHVPAAALLLDIARQAGTAAVPGHAEYAGGWVCGCVGWGGWGWLGGWEWGGWVGWVVGCVGGGGGGGGAAADEAHRRVHICGCAGMQPSAAASVCRPCRPWRPAPALNPSSTSTGHLPTNLSSLSLPPPPRPRADFYATTFMRSHMDADGTWGITRTPLGMSRPDWSSWGNLGCAAAGGAGREGAEQGRERETEGGILTTRLISTKEQRGCCVARQCIAQTSRQLHPSLHLAPSQIQHLGGIHGVAARAAAACRRRGRRAGCRGGFFCVCGGVPALLATACWPPAAPPCGRPPPLL